MGSVKIANGKITLCAERGKAITFVCNWENGRRLFVWLCVPGRQPSRQSLFTPLLHSAQLIDEKKQKFRFFSREKAAFLYFCKNYLSDTMNDLKQIKWGFIGCGEVTEKKSGPAFNAVEGSQVVAVMSRKAEKAQSYAERHGVKRWYTDPQELVNDREVNAVYIATPPSTHATYAIMAMKSGKAVYVEKPMASNYEDCCRINRIAESTGVPCFVAYYRRYLPYFQRVFQLVADGAVGKVVNVQIRFAVPPRDLDYNRTNLPWRVQADIAGGGYFYDLAPHQIDLLQQMFGPIIEAEGYTANRGGLYAAEDTLSACFRFENGLPGSGSWCFVAHESAKEDRIEIVGDKGSLTFSVFNYDPILLQNSDGRQEIVVENPPYVQLPLIKNVVEHLQNRAICNCDCVSATSVNWVVDRVLGKF